MPLTYVRVLGEQHPNNDSSTVGQAGWQTADNPTVTAATAIILETVSIWTVGFY